MGTFTQSMANEPAPVLSLDSTSMTASTFLAFSIKFYGWLRQLNDKCDRGNDNDAQHDQEFRRACGLSAICLACLLSGTILGRWWRILYPAEVSTRRPSAV